MHLPRVRAIGKSVRVAPCRILYVRKAAIPAPPPVQARYRRDDTPALSSAPSTRSIRPSYRANPARSEGANGRMLCRRQTFSRPCRDYHPWIERSALWPLRSPHLFLTRKVQRVWRACGRLKVIRASGIGRHRSGLIPCNRASCTLFLFLLGTTRSVAWENFEARDEARASKPS